MGININTPQIWALRCEVEKVFWKISSHSDLEKLSEEIELKYKEHVSVSTLERLWNYSTRNATNISVRILDIISRIVGADKAVAGAQAITAPAEVVLEEDIVVEADANAETVEATEEVTE